MTNKEAMTWIWENISIDVRNSKDITKDEMALKMAFNALGAIDQIRWERDTAIQQLKELGYELGEKPRKPMRPKHKRGHYECECGLWLLYDDEIPNENDSYCPRCGTKIDWEVEE